MESLVVKKKRKLFGLKKRDLIFYCAVLAYPVLQFCVFYIGVNFNSILLAFRSFEGADGYKFVGFDNFVKVIRLFMSSEGMKIAAKNSLIVYFIGLITGVPLSVWFAYYVFKKRLLSGFYKIMLFLPSIIPSIAMVIIYMYFAEYAVPTAWEAVTHNKVQGLLANIDTAFGAILFFNVFYGLGGTILMYLGTMNTISDLVLDAAKIDGATGWREFFYVVLPAVYPTLTTFLVLGIAGIFTNQFALYSFYGAGANTNLITFGYYLYMKTANASLGEYPELAAMGLLMTVVAVPVTLIVKQLLERFGPKED